MRNSIIFTLCILFMGCNLFQKDKNISRVTNADYSSPFIDPGSIDKCIIQVLCQGPHENSAGQGILYAQIGKLLYIAMPRHCLPENEETNTIFKRVDGSVIEYEHQGTYSYSSIDAALVILRVKHEFPTISEEGLVDRRIIIGDTAIMETVFDVRNVKRKFGIITEENRAEFPSYQAEPGDSGSPLVGRHGIIGMVVSIHRSNYSENSAGFIKISVFENLYIESTLNRAD